MQRNHRTPDRRRHLLVVAAALLLGAVACTNSEGTASSTNGTANGTADVGDAGTDGGPNSSPGVTDEEIQFSSFGVLTNNPTGLCMAECFDAGVKAYFDWRNSEGGLFGRDLVLTQQIDDQMMQNQQAALQIVSANDTFASFSASPLPNGWKDVADAGIPLYTLGIAFNEMNGKEGIFSSLPVTCVSCVQRRTPYAADLAGATKVASLGYGIAQSSKDCVTANKKSVEKYASETGQEMAYTNPDLTYGLPNGIAPEVTAMKDAGVDFISTCLDLNGVKTLEQELERQGMGDTPLMITNAYNREIYESASDLFEGDYVVVSFRPFEADSGDSQLEAFKEWMGKSDQPPNEIAIQGWINADLAYQGIKAAGPDFTRESVIEATNKMTAFTAGGLAPPIDWSRQHEFWTDEDPITHGPAQECIAFLQWKDGTFELVGSKDKPFKCWPGDPDEWVEPTDTNFE